MENYTTKSTSLYSAELVEYIVIEENQTTRKVLKVDLNDKRLIEGETVGIKILHQRKGKNDQWENCEAINLNSLKAGEGVKIDLDSRSTKKVYDELTKLYLLVNQHGVLLGTKDFTVGKSDEIIRVEKDRKEVIEKLIAKKYGSEIWAEILRSDPDLATRLALSRHQEERIASLNEFESSLHQGRSEESYWQDFFQPK